MSLKEANPELKLKLWIIEHFRVLPTDKRYKLLNSDQIELLFLNYVSQPLCEQYRNSYLSEQDQKEKGLPEEILKEMNYTKEEIEEINVALSERM